MAERCNFCREIGITCEKPFTPGEPKVSIVRTERGTQGVFLGSIDQCDKRQEVLGKVGVSR